METVPVPAREGVCAQALRRRTSPRPFGPWHASLPRMPNNTHPLHDFLDQPGRSGPYGGVLDEYARAAAELSTVVESIDETTFAKEQESNDPDTTSLRRICVHCINAAFGYSNMVRKERGLEPDTSGRLAEDHPLVPSEFRGHLGRAIRHTAETVEPLWDADLETLLATTFKSRWGQTYDAESIFEHGIVHLLRHRRQIERWLQGI